MLISVWCCVDFRTMYLGPAANMIVSCSILLRDIVITTSNDSVGLSHMYRDCNWEASTGNFVKLVIPNLILLWASLYS